MDFADISEKVRNEFLKDERTPLTIRVNSHWLERKYIQSFQLAADGSKKLDNIMGIPVQLDDTIDRFQLVYGE